LDLQFAEGVLKILPYSDDLTVPINIEIRSHEAHRRPTFLLNVGSGSGVHHIAPEESRVQ
jgi:hypothetical protein